MKVCSQCKESKPIDRFASNGTDGRLRSYCKDCDKLKRQTKEWKERRKEYNRTEEYKSKNRSRWPEKKLKQKPYDSVHSKKVRIKYKYGLEFAEFEKMMADQNHLCLICNSKLDKNHSYGYAIDHCHKTNKIRGILCSRCNLGIGHFYDDPNLIKKAVAYLELHDKIIV